MDIAQVKPERAARLMFQLPTKSRLFNKLAPSTQWGWDEIFANKANYLLETIVWQNATPSKKGDKAKHKRNKPKIFMPEFMKQPSAINGDIEKYSTDDIRNILAKPRV